MTVRRLPLAGFCLAACVTSAAFAAEPEPAPTSDKDVFGLGQIIVTAPRPKERLAVGGETLSSEAMYTFNRLSLDDAVNLLPGVYGSNSGGSRNERLIFVRGFDRFQVPLSIDGIRVYLPADGRLDYGRFLTPDIAEIQVAKGYASVLDGPGAMGGAINLVTRKPTKPLEVEVRGTLNVGRDVEYAGYNISGLIGTRHDKWYAQVSFTQSVTDHWDLAGGFHPTPQAGENGGRERDFSNTRDWRVNAKFGFTPNATDEYSISYTRQEGKKSAPLHVTDDATPPIAAGNPTPRFWTWPYWNIESIYFLSTTAIGDRVTLKTRAYRNKFSNLLQSFDDATHKTQTKNSTFDSFYADTAWGGSAQLDVKLADSDTLSLAGHYRRDKHVEWQQTAPTTMSFVEPHQTNLEDTYSVAGENRLDILPQLKLITGISYEWRDLKKAEEYGMPAGSMVNQLFEYPKRDAHAFNWQGQLIWQASADNQLHASVSHRARFPTIFERFSTQFGTAASNPGLKPERATNFEIGASHVAGPLRVEAAVFYSDIDDAIVSIHPKSSSATTTKRVNLGSAKYYGAEVSFTARLAPSLQIGGNYTYIHRKFHIAPVPPAQGEAPLAFALTDVPSHKAFFYADWAPLAKLHIVPSIDLASKRTTLDTFLITGTPPHYYRTGAYANASLRIDYEVAPGIQLGVGGRNLFDDNYQLTDGFPEPGRSFFVSFRGKF